MFKNLISRFFVTLLLLISVGMAQAAELVNINKADAATLQQNLVGIGEVKAKAIVNYRKKNGAFSSLDDLMAVEGIGAKTIAKNKKYLSLKKGASSTSTKQAAKKKVSAKKETVKKSAASAKVKVSGSKDKKVAKVKTQKKSNSTSAKKLKEKKEKAVK